MGKEGVTVHTQKELKADTVENKVFKELWFHIVAETRCSRSSFVTSLRLALGAPVLE